MVDAEVFQAGRGIRACGSRKSRYRSFSNMRYNILHLFYLQKVKRKMMSNTKFGWNQLGEPAPRSWRRFERAYLTMLMPAIAAFITGWGFPLALVAKLLLVVTFSGSAVKFVGMFLGNGQEYADKPKVEG
jgi:hypothetical protein